MDNQQIAERIFSALNERGAGLGNVSTILIESVLDEVLPDNKKCLHQSGNRTILDGKIYCFDCEEYLEDVK